MACPGRGIPWDLGLALGPSKETKKVQNLSAGFFPETKLAVLAQPPFLFISPRSLPQQARGSATRIELSEKNLCICCAEELLTYFLAEFIFLS